MPAHRFAHICSIRTASHIFGEIRAAWAFGRTLTTLPCIYANAARTKTASALAAGPTADEARPRPWKPTPSQGGPSRLRRSSPPRTAAPPAAMRRLRWRRLRASPRPPRRAFSHFRPRNSSSTRARARAWARAWALVTRMVGRDRTSGPYGRRRACGSTRR